VAAAAASGARGGSDTDGSVMTVSPSGTGGLMSEAIDIRGVC
jgi:hypothetical protein